MPDFPTSHGGLTLEAGGVYSTATGLSGVNVTASASAAWPSANLAIFVPWQLARRVTVYKLATGAGATAAGNFDIGIYDAGGNRIVSSGSTAKGSSVEHVIDIADTKIGPGLYYLAMSANGTNNYVLLTPSGTSPVPLQKVRLYGVLNMATAFVLPATATFAAATNGVVPNIAAFLRPY
jgi:hypothetical protein